MKIALASQPTIDDSIALNVNRIEKALASLRKKVDLVAFGESYLQGFNSLKWNFERDRTVAVSVDSQPIKMLRYTAKKYSVAVSFGYYELCDEAIYSSYMFIGKNGEIVNNFRRVSKGWKEYDITDEHYKEGDGFKTFTYMGKRIALAVCGDLWYEENIEQINKEKFDFKAFGQAIKAARKAKGISRNQLADTLNIAPRYIASIENSGQHPSLQILYELVTLLDVSVDQFFFPEREQEKSTRRRQLDTMLDTMSETDLKIMSATAKGIEEANNDRTGE